MIPITKSYLRRMRNEIEMRRLMVEVLEIEHRHSGGRFRFLCPECSQFDTAVNPKTNLGRCFGCRKNFNPIDLVIQVKQFDFLQAVEYLDRFLPEEAGPGTAPGQATPT